MSEYLQPGQHPDPDSLNAFIEGVLPEHERKQCLAHLAECPMCREVVYLAEEPLESEPLPVPPVTEKVPFWKRWLTPIPALSAAALAGTLILSLWLYQNLKSVPNTPELVAAVPQTSAPHMEPVPVQEAVHEQLKDAHMAPKVEPQAQMSAAPREKKDAVLQAETPSEATTPREAVVVSGAPPALPTPAAAAPVASPTLPTPAAAVPVAPPPLSSRAAPPETGIAGTITDPAGGAVSGAAVKLRAIAGSASRSSTSDPKGQFNVAGLEPGRYEMQVVALGFKQTTTQVDVQPNQTARADSTLSLGSVTESISVTAEAARVQTSSSAKAQSSAQPLPTRPSFRTQPAGIMTETTGIALPSKLSAGATVVSGKVMLATDSAGALFLSQNAGKKWKAIKPVWHGKVVSLVALSADPAFQLTTDGGTIWLSRDGNHWYAAAAQK